ncbi:hypothetical protein [Streptomyces sp. NPDC059552]|uniref:hypothetical protein n=1 Tax=Streptomyces sp. NPDC059552 TaxID=3346862 RepID=UPI0036B95BA1
MTNYVTDALPGWAEDPRVVWPVFIVSVIVAAVLAVVGQRLNSGGGTGPVRLVPLERVLASGMESLTAPHGAGPVRGRTDELAALRRMLPTFTSRPSPACSRHHPELPVSGVGVASCA